MTVYVSAGDIAYNEFSISGKTSALVRKGYSLQVPQGQYEFRLRRITENTSKDETRAFYS